MLTVLALATALATGCGNSGPKLYKVRGTVLVDGKPAGEALVFLHRAGRNNPNEPVPYGRANADGVFVVTTTETGDGAQEGEYVLTVVWPDMSKAPDGNGERPDLLGSTYAMAAKSTLKAKVEPKDNELPEIKLTAPPRGSAPAPKSGGHEKPPK